MLFEEFIQDFANINLVDSEVTMAFQTDYLRTIPEFDGNPAKLSEFIRASELILTQFLKPANPAAFINHYLLSSIRSKLVGAAGIVTNGRDVDRWNDLKKILQRSFSDQRDESSLLRDLMLLRQLNNKTPQNYYNHCQDSRGLLFSQPRINVGDQQIGKVKGDRYDQFTLKSYLTGLKEPLGSLVRAQKPISIEEALTK